MVFIVGFALSAGACRSAECDGGFTRVGTTCVPPGGSCGPCGDHEFCDASVVPNQCRCAPGYGGEPCVFTGLILDTNFVGLEDPNTGDPYWFDEGLKGATVEPLAPGSKEGELGIGSFSGSVICIAGSLTQVVKMPSYEVAQELHVAEVTYQAAGVHGLGVGFDRAWKRLPATGADWATQTFCLGQAAYGTEPGGTDVRVRISASERISDCLGPAPAGRIRVDRFAIRQAEAMECLGFGEVLNGRVLPDGEGWRFEMDNGIEGAIEPGEGSEGTSGARLYRAAGISGRATMTTQVSIPVSTTDKPPALRFWWKGSSQQRFEVELGTLADFDKDDRGRQLTTLVGTNSEPNHIYCLPPWTHGSVLDLSFSLTEAISDEETKLVVDEVEITSDPACGNNSEILDPGFEYAPNLLFGASLGSVSEAVNLVDDGGDGALELAYWTSGANLGMEAYVLVPASDANGGPSLTFFSKAPVSPSTDVQWVLGRSEVERDDVSTTDDWQVNVACLPPTWAGRWFRFQVRVGSEGSEVVPIDREQVLLDDFALDTSMSCPTN